MIAAGRISVDGITVRERGLSYDPQAVHICLDGKPIAAEVKKVFLFHKPRGVLCSMSDSRGRKTIADFTQGMGVRLFPVGRLDYDVSGLLLLTNDGGWANKMLHPRYEVERRYWAIVHRQLSKETIAGLLQGIELEDGPGRAKAAKNLNPSRRIERLFGAEAEGYCVEISVAEGRKHFVKKLLAAAGHPVLRLARVAFGEFTLGPLPVGALKEVRRKG